MKNDGCLSSVLHIIVCTDFYFLDRKMSQDAAASESPHQFETIMAKKGSMSSYDYCFSSEQRVREAQIAQAGMQLLREELGECVRTEGLNANVNCYDLRKKMFDLLTKDRYRGMLFAEGEEPANRAVGHIAYYPNGVPK